MHWIALTFELSWSSDGALPDPMQRITHNLQLAWAFLFKKIAKAPLVKGTHLNAWGNSCFQETDWLAFGFLGIIEYFLLSLLHKICKTHSATRLPFYLTLRSMANLDITGWSIKNSFLSKWGSPLHLFCLPSKLRFRKRSLAISVLRVCSN